MSGSSRFEIVDCANGESTLRDTQCAQEMHSRVGPRTEARVVYAEASDVARRLGTRRSLVLQDVGMGTGANAMAAMDAIEAALDRGEIPHGRSLEIESFETVPDGARFALENLDRFPFLGRYAGPMRQLLEQGEARFELGNADDRTVVRWRLFTGDYFEALSRATRPDLIYYDFYAPKSAPDLWTEERFRTIREFLGEHPCELYTYSAATPVRLALLLGGFYIGQGLRTAIKTETTAAATRYEDLREPLGEKWLEKLAVSTSVTSEESRARARQHPQWRRGNARNP